MAWELMKEFLKRPEKQGVTARPKSVWRIEDIAGRVREIVAEDLKVDIARVVPEAHLEQDLGCSLDVVEVFMRCEEEFGIEIPDEEAELCPTVGTLTAYIERKLAKSV